MRIEINLYASLARYLPQPSSRKTCTLELPEGTTVGDLLKRLGIPEGTIKIVFVNGVHAKPQTVLHDGDRLGVFPPVAGG